ncbi:WD40 repeat-like protein, partial [Tricholoma matsutake]
KHTLTCHTKPINALCISSDSALLLSGANDGYLVVWDMESRKEIENLYLPFHGPVCALACTPLNPDFTTGAFALASTNGSVQLYRLSHRDMITFDFASLTQAHETEVEGIAFDAHQRRLVMVGGECLKVWDMDVNGQLSLVAGAPQRPYITRSVAFFNNVRATPTIC